MITIYTTVFCGHCAAAKRLLGEKGAAFEEINVTFSPKRREEMAQRSGGRHSVPQIFVGGVHVGGSDELCALEREGKLDALLTSASDASGT